MEIALFLLYVSFSCKIYSYHVGRNSEIANRLPYYLSTYTQNLLRITFSFNDLMLKTNRVKKDFFYKDRLIFRLDDPVANMSIRHVYYA